MISFIKFPPDYFQMKHTFPYEIKPNTAKYKFEYIEE